MLKKEMARLLWYFIHFIPFTLWLFNIAMENGPFVDGLPGFTVLKNGGSFHGYVSHNQRVTCINHPIVGVPVPHGTSGHR